MITIKKVDENIYLGNPFIYKFKPEFYPGIIRFVKINTGLFEDISKLKVELLSDDSMEKISEKLDNYYKLINANYDENNFSNTEDILSTLNNLEEYRYFFKEMGASLKFNPLSRDKSAIQIRERADVLIHKYGNLIKPRVVFRYIQVMIENNELLVDGTDIRFQSNKLSKYFSDSNENKDAKKMIVYVVSIGSGIDDTVKILGNEGEMFDSYILNAIGAASAEMVAEDLNNYLNDSLPGKNMGQQYSRFSPGYGDWNVTEQVKLFNLLSPEKYIDVTLSEGHIMLPEKSTSGIMGMNLDNQKIYMHSGNE